jgi:hypothetical protein
LFYSIGTEINLEVDWVDSFVAQRDHGVDFDRKAGEDVSMHRSVDQPGSERDMDIHQINGNSPGAKGPGDGLRISE